MIKHAITTARKKQISKQEIILIFCLAIITVLLYWAWNSPVNHIYDKDKSKLNITPLARNNNVRSTLFNMQKEGDPLPEFHITIEPEFLASMTAGIPAKKGCFRTRFKAVPVKELIVDGQKAKGKVFMRHKGLCHLHWFFKQKTLKLQLKDDSIRGYRTFNLASLNSDAYLYEPWAARLMVDAGGIASRVVFAKVILNGNDYGLYQLVENLDRNLLVNQGLQKGPIYREQFHAKLGNEKEFTQLKDFWKKNAAKKSNWEDITAFNKAIIDSQRDGSDTYQQYLNIEQYITYSAVIALSGTNHLNTHNIPFYRPKRDPRFSFIGYDFYYPTASGDSANNRPLHPAYLPLNKLSRLVWADHDLRLMIYKRMAEIIRLNDPLNTYNKILKFARPHLIEDLPKGIIEELTGVKDIKGYELSNAHYNKIRNRIRYLDSHLNQPIARITEDWREHNKFQMAIEGIGMYKVTMVPDKTPCTTAPKIEVNILGKPTPMLTDCVDGLVKITPFIAERNDTVRPKANGPNDFRVGRNSSGAVLITVSNPSNIQIKNIEIESLVTGALFSPTSNWPFFIERVKEGSITLGDELPTFVLGPNLPPTIDLQFIVYKSPNSPVEFNFDTNKIELQKYGIHDVLRNQEVGPVICWSLEARQDCLEITSEMLFASNPEELFPKTSTKKLQNKNEFRTINMSKVKGCTNIDFNEGNWHVTESLIFKENCKVTFHSGAKLYFEPNAYMILRGPVSFMKEDERRIEFRPKHSDWGGVVIQGQQAPVEIQNADFYMTNEFSYGGRRYTGALNIINVAKSSLHNNSFYDCLGDDGLNVRGGVSTVRNNMFSGNRDAMDFDLGNALIEGNHITNSKDDGIDLGEVKNIIIKNNMILKSGDKGISVGEGSKAYIIGNHIEGNNFGIAVKDGSYAELKENLIKGNAIGMSMYEKTGDAGRPSTLTGNSWFINNDVSYKESGKTRRIDLLQFTELPITDKTKHDVDEKIRTVCFICEI